MSKIYLACPYSHPNESVMDERFIRVTKLAINLLEQGYDVYSPITCTHLAVRKTDVPRTFAYYKDNCFAELEQCNELWVCMFEGWKDSIGVNAEIDFANKYGLIVKYLEEI